MTHFDKLKRTSSTVQCGTAANDQHPRSTLVGSAGQSEITDPESDVSFSDLVDQYPTILDGARAEQPAFAAHEVEELSEFLQTLAEELGSGKLNTANSFTADERAPKPKLQYH